MEFIKRNWMQGLVLGLSVGGTALVYLHKITPEQYAIGAAVLATAGIHLPALTYKAPS